MGKQTPATLAAPVPEHPAPSEPLTFVGKVKRAFSLMTIEPALLVHMTASFLGNIMITDMMQFRACTLTVGLNATYCERSGRRNPDVQEIVADINIWRQVIDNLFPIIYVLFLGAWSDIYGRKAPILLTMIGYIVRYIGLLLCVYYPKTDATAVALVSSLPVSLTGGRTAISMALYAYIADTTSIRDRTFRMGVVTAIRTFGKSAGSALGGVLKGEGYGYTFIFSVGAGLDLFAFAYTLFFVRNTRKENVDRSKEITGILKDVCNFRNIIDSAKAFFRKREGKGRAQLILLVIILICTMAPMQGEEGSLQLFATSDQVGWNTSDYAYYGTYRMLIAFFGGLVSLGLLVETLKLNDATLGILACFSQIAGSLVYAFANGTLLMYIAPAVDILNGSMIIASRSMISKIVPPYEMGKVNSFVGTFDSSTPLAGNPIYAAVYRATLDSFPGAFFFLSVGLTIPPLFIFSWFRCNEIVPPSPSGPGKPQAKPEPQDTDTESNSGGSTSSIIKADPTDTK